MSNVRFLAPVRFAIFCLRLIIGVAGVVTCISLLWSPAPLFAAIVGLVLGLGMLLVLTFELQRRVVQGSFKGSAAVVTVLVGVGLCITGVAVEANAVAFSASRASRLVPVLLQSLGKWPVVLFLVVSGLLLLWGTYEELRNPGT